LLNDNNYSSSEDYVRHNIRVRRCAAVKMGHLARVIENGFVAMSLLLLLVSPSLASLAFMIVVITLQTLHPRLPSRSTTARVLLFPGRSGAKKLARAPKADESEERG
jgi:hypothetical protein